MEARPVIKEFFQEFERGSNTFDSDLIASQFSDPFMVANPDGGIQVVKKADFIAGVSKRRAFFESVGLTFTRLLLLEETPLADHYVMVKADWRMRFEKKQSQPVDATSQSTYILFIGN